MAVSDIKHYNCLTYPTVYSYHHPHQYYFTFIDTTKKVITFCFYHHEEFNRDCSHDFSDPGTDQPRPLPRLI